MAAVAENKTAKRSTRDIRTIDIRDVVVNHNPRYPVDDKLAELGYGIFQVPEGSTLPPLWDLGTSADPVERAEYARLIETYDPELLQMAHNLISISQLHPIHVRDNGADPKGRTRYQLVAGARRCLATLYNWCSGVVVTPMIDAEMKKGNSVALGMIGFAENMVRKQANPVQEAQHLQQLLNANPGMTRDDLASQFGVSRSTIANRLALLTQEPDVQRKIAAGELTQRHVLKETVKAPRGPKAAPNGTVPSTGAPAAAPAQAKRGDGAGNRAKTYAEIKQRWEDEFHDDHVRLLLGWCLGFETAASTQDLLAAEDD